MELFVGLIVINLIEAQILVGDLHISICRSSLPGRSSSTQRNPPISSLSGRERLCKNSNCQCLGAEFWKVTEKSCLLVHTFSLSSPDFRVAPEPPPQLFYYSCSFTFVLLFILLGFEEGV